MATFPTPTLLPHPLQALPEAGRQMSDTDLLWLLVGQLRPLECLVLTLNAALEHEALTYKASGPVLDLVWQSLNNLVDLLSAWSKHQPIPEVFQPRTPRADDVDA